jgi:hypothetical protein
VVGGVGVSHPVGDCGRGHGYGAEGISQRLLTTTSKGGVQPAVEVPEEEVSSAAGMGVR